MTIKSEKVERGEDTRARVDRRLVQNVTRKDGTPGNYYLRIRVLPQDARRKSLRVDIPMETNDRAEARARAAYVVRTLLRLGRQVMGDLACYLQAGEPTMNKRRRRRRLKRKGAAPAVGDKQLMLF